MAESVVRAWRGKVEQLATLTQEIPLWGNLPPFPWERVQQALSRILEQTESQQPQLDLKKVHTLGASELFQGLGERPYQLALSLGPCKTPFFFLASRSDLILLLERCAVSSQASSKIGIHLESPLFAGFAHFVMLELLVELNRSPAIFGQPLRIEEASVSQEESMLCCDITLALQEGELLSCRIACPESFVRQLRETVAAPSIEPPMLSTLPLTLQFEVGSTKVQSPDLRTLREGDLLLLDHCTYDLAAGKGICYVRSGSHTLLYVKLLKGGKPKLLDYALYEELSMQPLPPDDSDAEGFDTPLWDEEGEGHLFGDDDDEHSFDQKSETEEESSTPSMMPQKEHSTPAQAVTTRSLEGLSVEVCVEVARLEMAMGQLLALQPGNTLDLKVRPEEGVVLTVRGVPIAKGELVQIGGAMGVRITESPKP